MSHEKNTLNWYLFNCYSGGNAFWMAAFSLQQLLVTWILIGSLQESAERVGLAQLLIGIPGLIFMLWGGVIGDRMDGRMLLVRSHYLSALPPLLLALGNHLGYLGYELIITTALFASLLNAASSPVRASLLNRIAGNRLQFAISLSTAIGSLAAIAGTKLGGAIEEIGLNNILYAQALVFVIGGWCCSLLDTDISAKKISGETTLETILAGISHVWQFKLCRDLIGLNFVSSLFNAGGWLVAFPFIVNRVYDGNALLLANLMVIFTFGGLASNFAMLRFMPFQWPGRLYLTMQLTRILILVLIWVQPSEYLLSIAALLWGMNMGITTTTSRLMLQEASAAEYRARIMSIFTLTLMSAAPLGSVVLGLVIGFWGPLNALLPGMLASLVIFIIGLKYTTIWNYRSAAFNNN